MAWLKYIPKANLGFQDNKIWKHALCSRSMEQLLKETSTLNSAAWVNGFENTSFLSHLAH